MIESIVMLILVCLLVYVAYKIIKSIVKAIIIAFVVVAIIGSIFGFLVYLDLKSMQDGFWKDSLLVLEDQDRELVAVELQSLAADENIQFRVANDTRNQSKIITIHKEFFESLPEEVHLEEIPILMEKEDLISIMVSAQPVEEYMDSLHLNDEEKNLLRQDIYSKFHSTEDFRAALFILSVIEATETSTARTYYGEYSSGNLEVRPKTMVFRAADILPAWLVKTVLFILYH
jgi:hypothetical protein